MKFHLKPAPTKLPIVECIYKIREQPRGLGQATLGVATEYTFEARIGGRFFLEEQTDRGRMERQLEEVKQLVRQTLFEEQLRLIRQIKTDLYCGDMQAACIALNDLEDSLKVEFEL